MEIQTFYAPECPVCYEPMAPPVHIYQCARGHLVCGNCRPQIEECPSRLISFDCCLFFLQHGVFILFFLQMWVVNLLFFNQVWTASVGGSCLWHRGSSCWQNVLELETNNIQSFCFQCDPGNIERKYFVFFCCSTAFFVKTVKL